MPNIVNPAVQVAAKGGGGKYRHVINLYLYQYRQVVDNSRTYKATVTLDLISDSSTPFSSLNNLRSYLYGKRIPIRGRISYDSYLNNVGHSYYGYVALSIEASTNSFTIFAVKNVTNGDEADDSSFNFFADEEESTISDIVTEMI